MTGKPWPRGVRIVANFIGGCCIALIALLIWNPTDWRCWVFIALMNLLSLVDRTIAEGRS